MASVWIRGRETKAGKSFVVGYRVGGRDTPAQHGGSFRTRRLATIRAGWIESEFAAGRIPQLGLVTNGAALAPAITEAAKAWRDSRVDVADSTATRYGLEIKRIERHLRAGRVDEVSPADVASFVAALSDDYNRNTIRKNLQTLAMILDHAGVNPNPVRDKQVRLPRGEEEEINPPSADHVEAVFRLLPSKHRLPFLWLDWSGARVASVDLTLVGDYDEPRRRVRLRAATTKTRKALWVELHPVLADALEARLGPREDRNPDARLFAGSGADALRTSIGKGCKAAAVPLFSPHDLRHRRISLLHLRGTPWARIGEFVGQRDLTVTANTYTHVLMDETEVDYGRLLA